MVIHKEEFNYFSLSPSNRAYKVYFTRVRLDKLRANYGSTQLEDDRRKSGGKFVKLRKTNQSIKILAARVTMTFS